jgi:hypothetical protein
MCIFLNGLSVGYNVKGKIIVDLLKECEMLVVKELISQNKQYKAEIVKRPDGLFSFEIFRWYEDEWGDGWSPITKGLSLIDTIEQAIETALEALCNLTGEDIIIEA